MSDKYIYAIATMDTKGEEIPQGYLPHSSHTNHFL